MSHSREYTPYPEQHLGYPTGFEADRERQFRKFDRIIQLSDFDEQLATPENRLAYVDSLNFTEFCDVLESINGILINIPRSNRGFTKDLQVTYVSGSSPQEIMPAPEDKKNLMQSVLETVQEAKTLEDKAFLLAMGINLVHPFPEGNGRLARTVYHLLTEGYEPNSPRLRQLLGSEGENFLTPNPHMLRSNIMGNLQVMLGTHVHNPATYSIHPKIMLAVDNNDREFNPNLQGPGGSEPTTRSREVATILTEKSMAETVPALIIMYENQNAIRALDKKDGQLYFFLNRFWKTASPADIEDMYEIYRVLSCEYVSRALGELAAGAESPHMAYRSESGEVESMPIAVAMKKILRGELEMTEDSVLRPKTKRA